MESLRAFCPCLGTDSSTLVEMQPCKSGDGSGDEGQQDSTFKSRAQGWLATAMNPISSYRQHLEDEAARKERAAVLQAGALMKLIVSRAPQPVEVQLSADGAMVMWKSTQR